MSALSSLSTLTSTGIPRVPTSCGVPHGTRALFRAGRQSATIPPKACHVQPATAASHQLIVACERLQADDRSPTVLAAAHPLRVPVPNDTVSVRASARCAAPPDAGIARGRAPRAGCCWRRRRRSGRPSPVRSGPARSRPAGPSSRERESPWQPLVSLRLCVCVSLRSLSLCECVCVCVCVCVCLSLLSLFVCLSVCLSLLPLSLVCLSVCLSLSLS